MIKFKEIIIDNDGIDDIRSNVVCLQFIRTYTGIKQLKLKYYNNVNNQILIIDKNRKKSLNKWLEFVNSVSDELNLDWKFDFNTNENFINFYKYKNIKNLNNDNQLYILVCLVRAIFTNYHKNYYADMIKEIFSLDSKEYSPFERVLIASYKKCHGYYFFLDGSFMDINIYRNLKNNNKVDILFNKYQQNKVKEIFNCILSYPIKQEVRYSYFDILRKRKSLMLFTLNDISTKYNTDTTNNYHITENLVLENSNVFNIEPFKKIGNFRQLVKKYKNLINDEVVDKLSTNRNINLKIQWEKMK